MSVSQMHPSTAPSGRFWLASYPDGMAPEIAPLRHTSTGALVESCCAEFADRPAFTSMGKTLTFRDFDAASAGVAAWLVLIPGLALLFTTLAFNILGDGLRDALDPRRRPVRKAAKGKAR